MQAEEQKLIDIIRHDIAGDDSPAMPTAIRKDSSANHDKIVSEAAKEVLEGNPMTAEELVCRIKMTNG